MIRSFENYTLAKHDKLIRYVVEHLSEANKNEAQIFFGDTPILDVIREQASKTQTGLALFDNAGNPRAIGGISAQRTIWLIATADIDIAQSIPWFKAARKWLKKQLDVYRTVNGYCLRENVQSQHWMRWLGFDFAPEDSEATMHYNGHVFLYFQKS